LRDGSRKRADREKSIKGTNVRVGLKCRLRRRRRRRRRRRCINVSRDSAASILRIVPAIARK